MTNTAPRFFFHIGFNGLQYHGWQRQVSALSVQEVIEGVVKKVVKTPVFINGCGRTDAQVHASQYVFHANLAAEFDFDLLLRLNRALPPDIAIFDILPVHEQAHARFDAVQRTYDYFIHTRKDPFLHGSSAFYYGSGLDISGMRAAVALLPKYNDYYAFCKSPNSFEHTTGMIRIIVGRLLQIGTGKMTVDAFEHYLISKEITQRINRAYSQGLYLSKIVYPYLDLPQRTDFAAVFQQDQQDYWQEIG
jgi:tRNA pseudouridine38-40 synthase